MNLKIFILLFLNILGILETEAQEPLTITQLFNFCLDANAADNVYDFKSRANYNGYFSDDLQGTYENKYGHKLSLDKNTSAAITTARKSIFIHYYCKVDQSMIKLIEKDLASWSYFTGYSKDGSSFYSSGNGRFGFLLTKKKLTWEFMIYENNFEGFRYKGYAYRFSKFELDVNSYTNATDIKIKKGDIIYLNASGSIKLGDFLGSCGPEGINNWETYNRKKGLKHGCLMVKIDPDLNYDHVNFEWFAVGLNTSFTSPIDGILRFMVNDKEPQNNEGSFLVEYAINKPLNLAPTKRLENTPTRTQSNEQTYTQPVTEPTKTSLTSFKPITIFEDNFGNNKNSWSSSSKNQLISIEGNRLIYTNNEIKDKVNSMVEQSVSIKNNDDYIIEASMQSLTPCSNDKMGAIGSLLFSPNQSFYGFAIGDTKNGINFSVGNDIKSKEVRDGYTYTCIPSYFIKNTIAGTTNFLQNWTKSNLVADGGNVNILKLEKKGDQFNFYINNRLVSTKNSYPLGNNNTIKIVSSSFSKISVNNIKVILTYSVENNNLTNSSQVNKSNTSIDNNLIKKEKIATNVTNSNNNLEKVNPISIKSYKGTITNTTFKLKSECEMQFIKNSDGSFQLKGEFDKIKLVGKWDLKGNLIKKNKYIFKGDIIFGYEGTNVPKGTSAPIVITVSIDEKSMIGNYSIETNGKRIASQVGEFKLY
jgi:hypothetical protein